MIKLTSQELSLLNAAVARVARNENRKSIDANQTMGKVFEEIAVGMMAESVGCYDIANKRYLRVLFGDGQAIEVEVGDRPEVQAPTGPEGDDPDGGTPGATTATLLAQAA